MDRRGIYSWGLPTGLVPLSIRASDVRPSITAISVIGEGLAGWYLERQRGLRPLSRPVGEGPDFVFLDMTNRPPRTILVEVKATQQTDVKQQIKTAAIPLLQYARNATTPGNDFSCCIVGVIIKSSSDFELWKLEIELV